MADPLNRPLWSRTIGLGDLARGPVTLDLEADGATRQAIARELGLERLDGLTARVTATPWLDGAEIRGRLQARMTQVCSLSGEPFEDELSADFSLRAVPAGSAAAPVTDSEEIDLDPEGEDPPDVLESDRLDLAAYVVEHLALEIDPFPRKPGAVFAQPAEEGSASPFAVLADFRRDKPSGR
jgi:uncharacterized metal-binding protein YceD (DUF177 family)